MNYKTRLKLGVISALFILAIGMTNTLKAQIKIGVFADCQYCDCETAGKRYYRNSLEKLQNCINDFNDNAKIEFVVGLGDLIDRDLVSYDKVNTILASSENNVYNVSGNHDYSVEKENLEQIPKKVRSKKTYYSIVKEDWKFIFLNGNDITFQSNNKETVKQAEAMVAALTAKNQPNNHNWNGGIGDAQILWLEKQLINAQKKNQRVVLFCHYPLLPLEAHALWNSTEILSVLNKYSCVKAWINGHNHAGNYAQENGIHFITMKGMVDTKAENAYSLISFSEKEIAINGFGREENRKLRIQ